MLCLATIRRAYSRSSYPTPTPRPMELRHLAYFTAVAEHLNFSRAAEALHVAQPAISQQVRALERELGVPLFDRVGKRVALTEAGRALLPPARLPGLLMRFKQKSPGPEVPLREAGTETLLRFVEDNQLDLAIASTEVLPPSVEAVPFREENYILAVGRQHTLYKRKSVKMADLAGEAFILFPEGYKLREVTLAACRAAGFEPKV